MLFRFIIAGRFRFLSDELPLCSEEKSLLLEGFRFSSDEMEFCYFASLLLKFPLFKRWVTAMQREYLLLYCFVLVRAFRFVSEQLPCLIARNIFC